MNPNSLAVRLPAPFSRTQAPFPRRKRHNRRKRISARQRGHPQDHGPDVRGQSPAHVGIPQSRPCEGFPRQNQGRKARHHIDGALQQLRPSRSRISPGALGTRSCRTRKAHCRHRRHEAQRRKPLRGGLRRSVQPHSSSIRAARSPPSPIPNNTRSRTSGAAKSISPRCEPSTASERKATPYSYSPREPDSAPVSPETKKGVRENRFLHPPLRRDDACFHQRLLPPLLGRSRRHDGRRHVPGPRHHDREPRLRVPRLPRGSASVGPERMPRIKNKRSSISSCTTLSRCTKRTKRARL